LKGNQTYGAGYVVQTSKCISLQIIQCGKMCFEPVII